MVPENISKSEVVFNQAQFQQKRINDLMEVINACWMNPTGRNITTGEYNYCYIFRSLTTYYHEIRSKLVDIREEIDKIRDKLDSYIELNPVVTIKKKSSMYGSNGSSNNFNNESWKKIKTVLIIYQNKILDAADAKGMGNPTKKDVTKAALDL